MSVSLPSDEVAEDYKGSLEDLVSNDRYQIANLTLIAKENIEHAEAISRVLTNHINRTPPARKLPALYVLDSLVKNVGSPYTVYFGRNLHSTFMLAYSQVDGVVRRKLEEMLKTWREPVPGSLSTTPVFPFSSTQTIVDALNRFRASQSQVQRFQPTQSARLSSVQLYRNTPTPPQTLPQLSTSPIGGYQQPSAPQPTNQHPITDQYHHTSQFPYSSNAQDSQNQYRVSTPIPHLHLTPQSQHPQSQPPKGPPPGAVDFHKLHLDIDDLTTDAKIECATHPMDAGARKKLATLQTLKEILDSGSASETDLFDIQNSILQEMTKKLAANNALPQQFSNPSLPPQTQYHQPQPYLPPSQPMPTPSFLNSTNLAELLRSTATPTQAHLQLSNRGQQHQQHIRNMTTPPVADATPAPLVGEIPLLAQLRASGLLFAAANPLTGTASHIPNFSSNFRIGISVDFTSASIKIPRPNLLLEFLSSRPNLCTTCGRRFESDEVGRERKARHLDWHFKTKARIIEAEKRGQNRSWYVDEREWIASREYEDDAGPPALDAAPSNGLPPSSSAQLQVKEFIRTPTDPALRSAPCPIDQEPFISEWSEEVQDFIWRDAIQVGSRYYHASCYKEATKDRGKDHGGSTMVAAGMGRISTPDSILGKRKADV